MTKKMKLTTAHGNPIGDNQNSLTAGPQRPPADAGLSTDGKTGHVQS